MTSSVTAPLERQFGQMPGLNQMSSTSSGGASVITLQFSLDLSLDVAEQEVQAAINASGTFLPTDLPSPPIYNKVNPGGHADPDARAHVAHAAAAEARGPGRHADRAEDLAAAGRGPRQHQRRPAPGGAHPGQPDARSRPTGSRSTTCAPRSPTPTQPGEGQLRRPDARVDDRRQRPAQVGRRVPAADHRLPQRRADPRRRRRRHDRRRRELAARRVGRRDARDHPQRPAPARHQRDRGGRPREAPAAAALGVAAAATST